MSNSDKVNNNNNNDNNNNNNNIIAEPVLSLVVLAKLVWSLIVTVCPLAVPVALSVGLFIIDRLACSNVLLLINYF